MKKVIEHYSDRKVVGKMFRCPFHGKDVHPSARLRKGNRWECCACGRSGDAVDFVSMIFDAPVRTAASILNRDFHLGFTDRKLMPDEIAAINVAREERETLRKEQEKLWRKLALQHRACIYAIAHFAPSEPKDMNNLDPRYVSALIRIDELEWRLDQLSFV